MIRKIFLTSAISSALFALALPSQAQPLHEFIQEGDVIAELRMRNENVADDNDATDDAVAMTARARIGYETASMAGFNVLVEFDQVITLQDEYNAKSPNGPDDSNKSVVVDGRGGDVNRAQIRYTHDMASAILGRQRIIFDNARFVGNVGWRQNEQTYDALRLDLSGIKNLSATYVYMNQVNDIFYADLAVNNHLLNIAYTTPLGNVSSYAYLLEDDEKNDDSSNDTFGIRFKGKTPVAGVELLYAVEYASQTANGGNSGDKDFDADYAFLEGGVIFSGITVAAGIETLGGDGDYAFETPLATKHAFNGWADKFLSTNASTARLGLQDMYAKVTTKVAGVKLLAIYHDYSSDKDDVDLGREVNLLAAKSFNKHLSAGIKYAQYSAGDSGVDTDKLWLWGEVKF